jgi:hypothetical protein
MQIPADKTILYVPKVSIILVCIYPVDNPRIIVLLLGYNPNISLNIFGILVVSQIVNLKAPNVSCKLSFNNINCYLPPISNI